MKRRRKRSDRYCLVIPLAVDLLVAVLLSFRDQYFLWNLAYFWLPHLVMLGILRSFKLKPVVLVGSVYALALHLALYGSLLLLWQTTSTTVWAWYFSSLPGSVIGAIAGYTITARTRPGSRRIVYLTGLCTFSGAVVAQILALVVVLVDAYNSKSDNQNRTPTRSRRAELEEIHRYNRMDIALSDIQRMRSRAAGPTEAELGGSPLLDINFLIDGLGLPNLRI